MLVCYGTRKYHFRGMGSLASSILNTLEPPSRAPDTPDHIPRASSPLHLLGRWTCTTGTSGGSPSAPTPSMSWPAVRLSTNQPGELSSSRVSTVCTVQGSGCARLVVGTLAKKGMLERGEHCQRPVTKNPPTIDRGFPTRSMRNSDFLLHQSGNLVPMTRRAKPNTVLYRLHTLLMIRTFTLQLNQCLLARCYLFILEPFFSLSLTFF